MDGKWTVRATFLAAAVLLPLAGCEKGDVGQGDELAVVTVRASITLDGMEPDGDCTWPSLSADGRYVAFSSSSGRLTPNDDNGLWDIFLKDRVTGKIENLTMFNLVGEYPPYAPDDCYEPSLSADSRYVAFKSRGGWVPFTMPASTTQNYCVYRYDRVAKQYKRAYSPGGAFNPFGHSPMSSPSISADGRYVAFVSAEQNLSIPNPGGLSQIWVFDLQTDTLRLVSRAKPPAGATTPCDASCANPRISANGQCVVFESGATNLHDDTNGSSIQVYLATLSNPVVVEPVGKNSAGTIAPDHTFRPAISEDGRYVAFQSEATGWIPGLTGFFPSPYIVRRDRVGLVTEVVSDVSGNQDYPVFPGGQPINMSGDGRFIGFLSSEDSLYTVPFNYIRQVFVRDMSRDMQSGRFLASRHQDGTPSLLPCWNITFSQDGTWVAWDTKGSTLVDGDTNGASDIFLRGPLR